MDSFRLTNEASLPFDRDTRPRMAVPQPSGAETAAPFFTLIEQALGLFTSSPDIIGITGQIVAGGADSHGVSPIDARTIVDLRDGFPIEGPSLDARYGLLGCNMAVRRAAVGGTRAPGGSRIHDPTRNRGSLWGHGRGVAGRTRGSLRISAVARSHRYEAAR